MALLLFLSEATKSREPKTAGKKKVSKGFSCLTSWIAVAGFAAVGVVGKTVVLGSAPVAISPFDETLAGALACDFVTSSIVHSSQRVASVVER